MVAPPLPVASQASSSSLAALLLRSSTATCFTKPRTKTLAQHSRKATRSRGTARERGISDRAKSTRPARRFVNYEESESGVG